jgi:hypothetical protein
LAQRCHAHAAVGAGSPVHTAVAASSWRTCAVPLIAGPAVIAGAVAARAPAGTTNSPAPTTTTDARHQRARIEQTSMTARIVHLYVDAGNSGT